jgi:hypothetical protein
MAREIAEKEMDKVLNTYSILSISTFSVKNLRGNL